VSGGGEMLELRFHFGERDRCGDGSLDAAVMDACERRGVEAAALLRGVEGFGAKHVLRTDRVLSLSEDAPLVVVAVGERERVEGLVEEVAELATTGIATTSAAGVAMPVVGAPGDVVRATIWGARTGAGAPHLEAVASMRRHGVDAAMVLLGVDGVLGGERRRARFVAANRGVPAMTVAVGARGAIDAAVAEIGGAHLVTHEGVAPSSRIARASRHTRITLVTSEVASSGSRPRYVEFIHALRREGAAGATALRGVWGFRGDERPHGDRVLALRRDVPIVVETVDTTERAARWLELAHEVSGEEDVVYSQPLERTLTLG
jgi:PII-like signaling protein